jgi:Dehydrogenases with different specificities (related to short-chain alcohol dehydrogenases)
MEVNLKPKFLMSKYAISSDDIVGVMAGSIVNISSISATRPKGLTVYSTSKGAVLSLSPAMAVDHGGVGLRVHCLLPGPVSPPMVYASSCFLNGGGMSSELRLRSRYASLLLIVGGGWDIGKAVVYFSSYWARYMTGPLMIVDGGCSFSAGARGWSDL